MPRDYKRVLTAQAVAAAQGRPVEFAELVGGVARNLVIWSFGHLVIDCEDWRIEARQPHPTIHNQCPDDQMTR